MICKKLEAKASNKNKIFANRNTKVVHFTLENERNLLKNKLKEQCIFPRKVFLVLFFLR